MSRSVKGNAPIGGGAVSLRRRMVNVQCSSSRKTAREVEEELRGFFANSLGMLCVAGYDGYFKRLNPAWGTILGWPLEELQKRPFLEFVHTDDRAATLSEVHKLTRSGRTIFFENRFQCKDGAYRWLHWNANSLNSHQRIYALVRDVTLRKELQNGILQASDREKERLGRELHDGLCQKLAGVAALSTALSRRLAADSRPAAADAAYITRLVNAETFSARSTGPIRWQSWRTLWWSKNR